MPASVDIDSSQFPENVRAELLAGLRSRRINHKFHYDSVKQVMQWLALQQAYSPECTDLDYGAIYHQAFAEAITRIPETAVHLVGLGCGGGQKDVRLIKELRKRGGEVFYTPLDVSTAMVLVARSAALEAISPSHCFPFVCDLAIIEDLPKQLEQRVATLGQESSANRKVARLFTFFGMIPNFEPQMILPKLEHLLAPQDYLLFSANLAPGDNYKQGVQHVLPLYDNKLTREWLMTFLLDLGVNRSDGRIHFMIEDADDLKRISAYFDFTQPLELQIDAERFAFRPGDSIRLFFSYRHTPSLVRSLLAEHKLDVLDQWITASEEEGVFLVRPRALA